MPGRMASATTIDEGSGNLAMVAIITDSPLGAIRDKHACSARSWHGTIGHLAPMAGRLRVLAVSNAGRARDVPTRGSRANYADQAGRAIGCRSRARTRLRRSAG